MPVSTIAGLSSGEFVGLVADTPEQPISLKAFHARIINDPHSLNAQRERYLPIPIVREITPQVVQENYNMIRQEIQDLVDVLMDQVLNTDALKGFLVKKE